MTPDVLIHGDTFSSAPLRHELPLGIADPLSYFEVSGRRVAVISTLDAGRAIEAAPGLEVIDPHELGLDELIAEGMRRHDLDVELCLRAAQRLGAQRVLVPNALPVAVADRLRAEGVEVIPDEHEFIRRRRSKNPAELAGIRRAQAAADAGMAAAAELLREARPHRTGVLASGDGEPLTSERVRTRIREVCAALGAPADDDIIVAAGGAGASGHENGSGPIPACVPVIVDIWPRDERTGCWSDMTRTFVAGGDPPEDVAAWHQLSLTALEDALAACAPGVTGRELFDRACDVFEAAGEPTQRTKPEGEALVDGFFHSLGPRRRPRDPRGARAGADRGRRAGAGRRGGHRARLLPQRLRGRAAGGPGAGDRGRLRAADRLSVRARAVVWRVA